MGGLGVMSWSRDCFDYPSGHERNLGCGPYSLSQTETALAYNTSGEPDATPVPPRFIVRDIRFQSIHPCRLKEAFAKQMEVSLRGYQQRY